MQGNNDDAVSGIHFMTGRPMYAREPHRGSSSSLASQQTMTRVNSVVNSFKRLFGGSQAPLTPDCMHSDSTLQYIRF